MLQNIMFGNETLEFIYFIINLSLTYKFYNNHKCYLYYVKPQRITIDVNLHTASVLN